MNLHDPTPDQLAEYEEWCATRPPAIAEVARRLPPWKLYWMDPPGQRVTIYAYDEELDPETKEPTGKVSLKVDVAGKFNFLMFERRVFGVSPNALTECDLPEEDELVGALLHGDQAEHFIDAARSAILEEKE